MSYWPELRHSMVVAARRQHEANLRDERPRRAPRRPRALPLPKLGSVAVLVATVTAIAVAVVALTVLRHAHPQSGSAAGGHGSTSVNERAARRAAAEVLRQLVLPAGAVRTGLVPGAPFDLSQPADLIGTPHRVDTFSVWHLRQSPGDVLSFIKAHRPAGSRFGMRSEGQSGRSASNLVIDQASFVLSFPGRGHPATFRELAIEVGRLSAGGSVLRADGEVGWLYPRTAENQVPATVDEIRVGRLRLGYRQPRGAVVVTSTRQIQRLIGVLNTLPVALPDQVLLTTRGIRVCTGMRLGLWFYSAGRAQPVANAVYIPSCGFLYLVISNRSHGSVGHGLLPGTFLRTVPPIRELTSLGALVH